jgi:hypothetical protein
VLHIKYSGIFWRRKLSRATQEMVKYILNVSIILCNILPPTQYWKQKKALTQTSCGSGIEGKAASVHCTTSTGGNAGTHLGFESQKRLLGDWVTSRWYVSDPLFKHHDDYFLSQVISNLWNFTTSTLIGIHLGLLICALSLLITMSNLWGGDDLIYIFLRSGLFKEVKGSVCGLECKTRNWK